MGNSTSTAVSQRLDHASKTGGLSLSELKLEEVYYYSTFFSAQA